MTDEVSNSTWVYLPFLNTHISQKNIQKYVVKTNLEVFYDLTDQYEDETQGLPVSESDLVPKVEVRLLKFRI